MDSPPTFENHEKPTPPAPPCSTPRRPEAGFSPTWGVPVTKAIGKDLRVYLSLMDGLGLLQ